MVSTLVFNPPRPLARPSWVIQADKHTVVLGPSKTPMRLLTPAERASLAPRWDADAPVCEDWTVPAHTALRIRHWAYRDGEPAVRGSALAFYLHDCFWPGVRPKYPLRGFDLLRLVDVTADQHSVRVYIGQQRLTDRLAELGWSE